MFTTRRFFIGGLASAFALGPQRMFASEPGAFAGGKPALAFGVLSDVHVALAPGGKKLNARYNTETLTKAFEWFRDNGADAVVIAGDMAHCGLAGELKALADAWFKVFPGDKAPDGRHVERIFVFGNHDWSSPGRAKAVFPDEKERKANLLVADPKKWWREIFHEDWTPFFEKQVNGYPFIGAHWCNGGCNGKCETFTKGLRDFYAGRKFDPAKPFFHVQHPHPRGTVHGDKVWGQDDGISKEVLSAHPNAISFSGHSHTSLTDERSVWQGAFTAIGCATLRDVSLNIASGALDLPRGFENGRTYGKDPAAADALKAMKIPDRFNCRQGQFMRVYADRVVLSRREFITGAPLCDDMVMPLPAAENRPFAFEPRREKAVAPEFPAGAELKVELAKGAMRSKRKVDVWKLTVPAAVAVKSARAGVLEVVVTEEGGAEQTFGFTVDSARFPVSDPRFGKPSVCKIACERFKARTGLTFSVRAVSSWGKKSAPLTAKV